MSEEKGKKKKTKLTGQDLRLLLMLPEHDTRSTENVYTEDDRYRHALSASIRAMHRGASEEKSVEVFLKAHAHYTRLMVADAQEGRWARMEDFYVPDLRARMP